MYLLPFIFSFLFIFAMNVPQEKTNPFFKNIHEKQYKSDS